MWGIRWIQGQSPGFAQIAAGVVPWRDLSTRHSHTAEREIPMGMIAWEYFTKELRVGRVLSAEPFPLARKPAYILQVD
jgi:hypothetical protein